MRPDQIPVLSVERVRELDIDIWNGSEFGFSSFFEISLSSSRIWIVVLPAAATAAAAPAMARIFLEIPIIHTLCYLGIVRIVVRYMINFRDPANIKGVAKSHFGPFGFFKSCFLATT